MPGVTLGPRVGFMHAHELQIHDCLLLSSGVGAHHISAYVSVTASPAKLEKRRKKGMMIFVTIITIFPATGDKAREKLIVGRPLCVDFDDLYFVP
ncbi:hypothetical protein HYV31_04180 [candidate division WWE3 bacterium]|nr:hypothetical protein [candidate division WWE3 bacterium]